MSVRSFTIPELQKLPKVELHEHLDGSLRIQTLIDLAQSQGVRLPSLNAMTLGDYLVPPVSSLETYLQAFAYTVSVLQTQAALERVAAEIVEDWYSDGIVYGEIRFAPELHCQQGLRRAEVVEAVLRGVERAKAQYPVDVGLILCNMRQQPPNLETAELVQAYRDDGVVGFDIAGPEDGYPPQNFQAVFDFIAEHHLNATCHAGEITNPEYVHQAVIACRAKRIGHGLQLIQEWSGTKTIASDSISQWILNQQIPLEICLSSNVQTGATASLASHPLGRFLQKGFAVVLCTDNRLMSATSLSQELALAQQTFQLSQSQIMALQVQALNAAFCPYEKRQWLLQKYFPEYPTIKGS